MQVQTETAQNTEQGDAAAPSETGTELSELRHGYPDSSLGAAGREESERAAAAFRTTRCAGRVRSTEGSITPSSIAQGCPTGNPWITSGRTLRGASSDVEQMHNYISSIGSKLHEVIGNRDADLIRSYCRALNSGIARAQELANKEADGRGWDPDAVGCMLQEVEETTATLLPAAEQIMQELEAGKRGQSSMPPV